MSEANTMTTQTEALKLALEAMESFQNGTNGLYEGEFQEEITAIKEALAQPEQETNKNGSPCPEFWDWLPKAYNFEGDGNFTKYNMEVAFLAGKQASQPEPPPECQTEALKLALEALEKMDARFGNTTFRHEIQPSTYGCHHISETCSLCEGLVTGWKAVRAANQAITAIKEALMSVQDGAQPAAVVEPHMTEQHKQRSVSEHMSMKCVGEPVAFLANGVRFKLNFDSKGRVRSLWNYLSELDGRWVALVAAEDDCHLKLTAPPQGEARGLSQQQRDSSATPLKPLTDEQIDFLNFLYGAGEWDGVWFEEKHPTEKGAFWWRKHMKRLFDTTPYVPEGRQQRKPLSAYINSAKINATDLPHIVVEKLEKAIEAAHGIKE